jgi:hypothetical protein
MFKELEDRLYDSPQQMTLDNLKTLLDLRKQIRRKYTLEGVPDDDKDLLLLVAQKLRDKEAKKRK